MASSAAVCSVGCQYRRKAQLAVTWQVVCGVGMLSPTEQAARSNSLVCVCSSVWLYYAVYSIVLLCARAVGSTGTQQTSKGLDQHDRQPAKGPDSPVVLVEQQGVSVLLVGLLRVEMSGGCLVLVSEVVLCFLSICVCR